MDEHKIAFIACVNDEEEFQEALYYIDRLHVPMGYETDVIAVREAPSMAAGYNAAMRSSDAKYKIYIHQDVFLIYQDMLYDMLAAFGSSEDIGMLGVLGARMLPGNAVSISRWDTGMTYCNGNPPYFRGYEREHPVDVMAIDGMLMATQYDIEWREDLFDGWDFYDISQCFEFSKRKKRVVVSFQKEVWSYHDNRYSRLDRYNQYRKKLIMEYGNLYPFKESDKEPFVYETEYQKLREQALTGMKELVDTGQIDTVCAWLKQPENQGEPAFQELELICKIYSFESQKEIKPCLYENGRNFDEMLASVRRLRHLLKRIEFGCEQVEDISYLTKGYSVYSVAMLTMVYAYKRKELYRKLLEIYKQDKPEDFEVLKHMEDAFSANGKLEPHLMWLKGPKETFQGKKKLVIIQKLDKQGFFSFKENEDMMNSMILTEDYTEEILVELKKAEIVCGNAVKLVADMQEKLYSDFEKVVVYGESMEEYVKIFHNTDIRVTWYVTEGYHSSVKYSANISRCIDGRG